MKETKFQKLLRWKHHASIVNAIVAATISIAFWDQALGASIWSFLLGLVTSLGISWVFNFLFGLAVIHYLYRGDADELDEDVMEYMDDAARPPNKKHELTESTHVPVAIQIVDAPSEHIGSYQGEFIYEWLDIIRAGQQVRVRFHSTIDARKFGLGSLLPNQILFPPGIVYEETV